MNIPSHLYKYRSLRTKKDKEHTLRILTHNEIYFATCKDFNDPFDCNLHISANVDLDTHKTRLKRYHPDWSEEKLNLQTLKDLQTQNIRKREAWVNKEIRNINKTKGIYSMSAKRDNILMWSHYADCHRGICIEFKTTSGRLFGCDILKVKYRRMYPKFSVYDNMDLKRVRKFISTKSSDWKYEEEWRIIYREPGCQYFPSEAGELSGVILGSQILEKNKELVINSLRSGDNNQVTLYEARECKDRFVLDIIPIDT